MGTKKRSLLVWMAVCVLLVFVCCAKKGEDSVSLENGEGDGQKEYVEKALKEIEKLMRSDGITANKKKVKRSLAKHILKDHTLLMALFQSGNFDGMEDAFKDKEGNFKARIRFNTDPTNEWTDPEAGVWRTLYLDKKEACEKLGFLNASIELEIYAVDITLDDPENPTKDLDCISTESFNFKIIALDENGNVISNQDGEGERNRDHSEECPWV